MGLPWSANYYGTFCRPEFSFGPPKFISTQFLQFLRAKCDLAAQIHTRLVQNALLQVYNRYLLARWPPSVSTPLTSAPAETWITDPVTDPQHVGTSLAEGQQVTIPLTKGKQWPTTHQDFTSEPTCIYCVTRQPG